MFNTSEVSNEYNLLNDFLNSSLLDDSSTQGEDNQNQFPDATLSAAMGPLPTPNNDLFATSPRQNHAGLPSQGATGTSTPRQNGVPPHETAREKYFLEAADPAGTDTPEHRLNKLLKAKYDAGLLKPFNYVGGYARLQQWMAKNLQPASRERIMMQFNWFRPRFRERIQKLNDLELVMVEMWFEQELMKYDRVFASGPAPACCWRRTGEIFRGTSEMADLLHVPLDYLRDVSCLKRIIGGLEMTDPRTLGQASVAFDYDRRLTSQLLGKVHRHCIQHYAKGRPYELHHQVP